MAEIHVGDIGTAIIITIKDEDGSIVDVSTATEKLIYFKKPDTSLLTKNAALTSGGTDGRIHYTFASGELDQAGTWRSQARVTVGSGTWYSSGFSFEVVQNLDSCA